jgi:polygalacturonase
MSLPISVPYTFGTASSTVSLSWLDSDFSTVTNAINGIGNGTVTLSSPTVGTLTASNVSVTNLLASNATITNLGYTAPFSNSVTQTVTNKLSQTVSVKDFGAVGNGTTDDTTAIQNAINTGYNVYFPKGNYFVTAVHGTTVFSLQQGQHLFGDGVGATTIVVNPTNPSSLAQSIFTITQNDCGISNMSINGGAISSIQNMIHVYGAYRATFNNLYIFNVNTNYGCFRIENSFYCTVTNLQIDAYVGTFASQTAYSHGLFLVNSTKTATYHRCNNITINGGNFGIAIWYQENCVLDNLILSNPSPSATGNSGEGINFNNSSYCSITNATIYARTDGGITIYTDTPSTGVPENNVFSNITSNYNTLDGIYVAAGRNNQFSNIVCMNNNQGNPTYGTRYGIYINVDSAGLTEQNSFSNIIASDTQATPTQSYGIAISSGVIQSRFFNVVAQGNANGQYTDSGTSTSISLIDSTTYRNLFNYGISVPNGGNANSGYWAQNNSGTDVRILTVKNDGYIADGTSVISGGGGIRFVASDGSTVLGYVTNAGQWYLNFSGTLEPVTPGSANSGGSGYRQLVVPN